MQGIGVMALFGTVLSVAGAAVGPAYASDPKIGLRPGFGTTVHAQAAADAGANGVHMALEWDEIQPTPAEYDWSLPDQAFAPFLLESVDIASVRVVGAPDWAVAGGRCPEKYRACPPAPRHYEDYAKFVRAAVGRYGPGTDPDIERFVFWNEPSQSHAWGGLSHEQGAHREYSDVLARFYRAVTGANPLAEVDAGEITSGGNKPMDWAEKFTKYNSRKGRNGNYDRLTIHAYSKYPGQVVKKIRAHDRLPGVTEVSVSEFGWASGEPNPQATGESSYKCASDSGQERKFVKTVRLVREETSGVGWLVWLHGIDRSRGKEVKCIDDSGYYDQAVVDHMNPYGLFRAARDGSASTFDSLSPRPIRDAFREFTMR